MADLSGRDRATALRERGQIMLIAGFVLAAAFISLALVLNSVIYTENLATRDTEARGSEATAFAADAIDGGEKMIEYANRNITVGSESFGDIKDDFDQSLRSMNNVSAKIQAGDGERTNVSINRTVEGRRLGQQNASRNFTDIDGDENWDLASDIEGTRAFRINVTDSFELVDASGGTGPFTVTVDGDSGTVWKVKIFNVSGPATRLETTSGTVCALGEANPEIDVIAGTIDGEQCPNYDFRNGTSEPYSLAFENASAIRGNFSVVVNSTTTGGDFDSDTDTPFNASAIYSSRVHIFHESSDIVYETEARLLPGESDEE